MQFNDQTFANTDIVIDGDEYRNCRFEKCRLTYRGGGPLPAIADCQFTDCNWQFEDAAERTLVFMKLLYHGMGERGPEMIESTMQMVRQPFA